MSPAAPCACAALTPVLVVLVARQRGAPKYSMGAKVGIKGSFISQAEKHAASVPGPAFYNSNVRWHHERAMCVWPDHPRGAMRSVALASLTACIGSCTTLTAKRSLQVLRTRSAVERR